MARFASAADIINQVSVEVGLAPSNDPYSSEDTDMLQLGYLLTIAGQELLLLYPWRDMVQSHQIQTQSSDTGDYPLPDDFNYMINQTGWERSENVPLIGPLSAQDWTYLLGRDLVNTTIYASFRLQDNLFRIFPQPPPDGLDINFEYISTAWVTDQQDSGAPLDAPGKSSDIVQFNKILISRYLKVKFLEAKGRDTTKAQDDFNQMFDQLTGWDKGAEIINAGGLGRQYPYLNAYRNVGDTGFGN